MSTLTYNDTLQIIECGDCHISFAIPVDMYRNRTRDGKSFWCPNGCKISYHDDENAKLKRRLQAAEAAATHAQDQRLAAERSKAAIKGQLTKTKNRVANGVCPCCNRSFVDLASHMAGQHPDYASGAGRP